MTSHIEPRSSKVEWYRKHLIKQCRHVSDEVRAEAQADAAKRKRKTTQTTLTRLQDELAGASSQNENITLVVPSPSHAPPGTFATPSPLLGITASQLPFISASPLSAQSSFLSTATSSLGPAHAEPARGPPEVDYDKWIVAAAASGGE